MFENGSLFFIAGREGVNAVCRKSARKISPVVRIVAALHCNLVPVIKLRRAAHRHNQSLRHLQPFYGGAGFVHESFQVMIPNERD